MQRVLVAPAHPFFPFLFFSGGTCVDACAELIDRLRSSAAELRREEAEDDRLGLDEACDLADGLELALKALDPR